MVPCDAPHPGQIYLEVLILDATYPRVSSIRELADAECAEGFAAWVGTSVESSELQMTYLYPDEENFGYDRTIKCIVVAPEDVTGTLEGSGR